MVDENGIKINDAGNIWAGTLISPDTLLDRSQIRNHPLWLASAGRENLVRFAR